MGLPLSFGNFLIKKKMLTSEAWARVEDVRSDVDQGLASTITGLGLMSETDLAVSLANFTNSELATEGDWPLDVVAIPDLNPTFLKAFHILPVGIGDSHVGAILADPTADYAINALEFATGKPVRFMVATLRQVETAINRLYFGQGEQGDETNLHGLAEDIDRLKELATDAPVIRFVDRLIDEALSRRASDIHVEPIEDVLQIRFRVDGILVPVPGPPKDITAAVVSRLKILSGMDIAERRLAQDGRMRVRAHGKQVDFRVATSPSASGEAVVLRLLDRGSVVLNFDALGFNTTVKERFRRALSSPDGIVLVTGPTGSGKTTTLYTGLSELNTPERKILTIEDPVEYVLDGLGQVQVDNKIGRTFAKSLRSFLRQDPDIIMVGEIRDSETASIAIQASLTGHLVLSTLHTNSASAAVTRLLDMGVEEYLLASTVRLVLAQRLVRLLCTTCKAPDYQDYQMEGLRADDQRLSIFKAVGCEECGQSGYRGRTIITELLEIDAEIEAAIIEKRSGPEIQKIAEQNGLRTLLQTGFEKVAQGQTSVAEVLRVTSA